MKKVRKCFLSQVPEEEERGEKKPTPTCTARFRELSLAEGKIKTVAFNQKSLK